VSILLRETKVLLGYFALHRIQLVEMVTWQLWNAWPA